MTSAYLRGRHRPPPGSAAGALCFAPSWHRTERASTDRRRNRGSSPRSLRGVPERVFRNPARAPARRGVSTCPPDGGYRWSWSGGRTEGPNAVIPTELSPEGTEMRSVGRVREVPRRRASGESGGGARHRTARGEGHRRGCGAQQRGVRTGDPQVVVAQADRVVIGAVFQKQSDTVPAAEMFSPEQLAIHTSCSPIPWAPPTVSSMRV